MPSRRPRPRPRHRRRRRRRSPEAGPLDDDDLLCEILLRLPPQPSSLPRASLVCKRWRRLVSDRGFSRRFRRHHRRNPPLLGLFDRHSLSFVPTLDAPNRVPPGRFSLQRGDGDRDRFLPLGCRHGLVLIFDISRNKILVWDPFTGVQHRLDIPPGLAIHAEKTIINGAVLRAGDLRHFQVVLTVTDSLGKQHGRVLACVYSSETGVWGDLIATHLPSEVLVSAIFPPTIVNTGMPAVLAGGSLYWMLVGNFVGVLEFDLDNQSLSVIRVPVHMLKEGHYAFSIMRAEDGGLGLLFQTNDHNLQLWKRKIDHDGVASWGLGRSIELDKLLFLNSQGLTILGFAEENNVVFLWTSGVLFMVHLESLKFKKLFETNLITPYHPFEGVYTAETGIGDEHDAADLLHLT